MRTESTPPVDTPSRKFYRPELDILRFLAFFMVFLTHTSGSITEQMHMAGPLQSLVADVTAAGGYGVDLFFLLSAYLITTLFIVEYENTLTIDIPAFYARRVLRIWPLYFSFVAVMVALSYFTPVQFPHNAIVPFLLFYSNWYFVVSPVFSPGSILWSVSVEEQFYLICPILFRFLTKSRLLMLCVTLIVVANATRFIVLMNSDSIHWASHIWFNTIARLDPIAIGVMLAVILDRRMPVISPVIRGALLTAGLAGVYAARRFDVIVPPSVAGVMIAYPLADLAVLAVLLSFLGTSLSWRPLVYLGQISYGLYVFHVFSLDTVKLVLLRLTGECTFLERGLIALPITIAMASLSYRYLEKPFLRLKGQVTYQRLLLRRVGSA